MVIKENFFREVRERHGIKLTELARRVGVTKQALTGFEKKRHGVSDEVLIKIANILGVRPDEIVPGKEISNTQESQKYLIKAIKITDKYYGDQNFSEELMIDIATELYNFIVAFDQRESKDNLPAMKRDLKRKVDQGLAAKCFLDFLDKK